MHSNIYISLPAYPFRKMTFQPLSSLYIEQAKELYLSAFPQEERRPVDQWLHLHQVNTSFHILVIKSGNAFSGILTYWDFNEFIYIEHFATDIALRGRGLGQKALCSFIKGVGNRPIILEVELPQTSLAKRRIGFYERVGFSIIDKPYKQPPYPGQNGFFPLLIMSTDPLYANEHYSQVISIIYREVYQVAIK